MCVVCYACLKDQVKCPAHAEKQRIMDAIEWCDLLVVTTPTYNMNMSAPLKAFFDFTFDYWMVHKPTGALFGKKAVVFSSCAGGGAKAACKEVKKNLFFMGVPSIRCVPFLSHSYSLLTVPPKKMNGIEKKILVLAKRYSQGGKPRIGLKTRLTFFVMGKMHQAHFDGDPSELVYWNEQGWLNGQKPWKQ